MDSKPPLYSVKRIKHKGVGLIATRHIPKSTLILSDSPIIRGNRHEMTKDVVRLNAIIAKELEDMDEHKQKAFLKLHNADWATPELKHYNIAKTNALPLGSGPNCPEYGVFPIAARINHACLPNAHNSWNPDLNKLNVYSLIDIEKGEEITISYLIRLLPAIKRNQELKAKFKFHCGCKTCSLSKEEEQKTDRVFRDLDRLQKALAKEKINTPEEAEVGLFRARKAMRLCRFVGIEGSFLYALHIHAAKALLTHGDLARGRVFAKKAYDCISSCEGGDSQLGKVAKEIMKDPLTYKQPDTSAWATSKYGIPQGITPMVFEEWLWRDAPHTDSWFEGLHAVIPDFLDARHFPTYAGLPAMNNPTTEFYHDPESSTPDPLKHWCLFVEITAVDATKERIYIDVVDRLGRSFTIGLWFDDKTWPTRFSGADSLKPQQSVALLYPELFCDNVILLNLGIGFKRIPVTLEKFLALNATVLRYYSPRDETMLCHGCDRRLDRESAKRCARCKMMPYCDRDCQASAWTKGHKDECKLLRDEDVKRMHLLEWSFYSDRVEFPLNKILEDPGIGG